MMNIVLIIIGIATGILGLTIWSKYSYQRKQIRSTKIVTPDWIIDSTYPATTSYNLERYGKKEKADKTLVSLTKTLKEQLYEAIDKEDYETAVKLRDKINKQKD